MKPISALKSLFFLSILLLASPAARAASILEWERSLDLKTWEKVPPAEIQYTVDGALIVAGSHPNASYRVLIRPSPAGDGVLNLAEVPTALHRRAAQLIEEMRDHEAAPNWRQAKLRDFVRPLFRPDVQGVAYYEFAVSSVLPDAKPGQPFGEKPAGFIILSTGDHDFPIAHWSDQSEPPSVELSRRAAQEGKRAVKFYKLDVLSYAGEDANGEITCNLGTPLLKVKGMDPDWLKIEKPVLNAAASNPEQPVQTDESAADIKHTVQTSGPNPPPIEFQGFADWKELKAGFAESFAVLAEAHRRQARKDWDVEKAAQDFGEGLRAGEVFLVPLLFDKAVVEIKGDVGQFATIERVNDEGPRPDLLRILIGLSLPDTTVPFELQITYPNKTVETHRFVIMAREPKAQNHVLGHWSSWTCYMAGADRDQRLYEQFDISGCASGCGATAWAMLFGWADNQAHSGNVYWRPRNGLYLRDGGYGADAIAPPGMEPGIVNISREIRGYIHTFCAFGSGATTPWDMQHAWQYFTRRTGTYMRCNWNSFGFHSDDLRDIAVTQIRDRRTPTVIGTGWLSHYPLAYGYKQRTRTVRACDICVWNNVDWERCFLVNQGWAGSGNGWVGSGTWFAGRICPNGDCP